VRVTVICNATNRQQYCNGMFFSLQQIIKRKARDYQRNNNGLSEGRLWTVVCIAANAPLNQNDQAEGGGEGVHKSVDNVVENRVDKS